MCDVMMLMMFLWKLVLNSVMVGGSVFLSVLMRVFSCVLVILCMLFLILWCLWLMVLSWVVSCRVCLGLFVVSVLMLSVMLVRCLVVLMCGFSVKLRLKFWVWDVLCLVVLNRVIMFGWVWLVCMCLRFWVMRWWLLVLSLMMLVMVLRVMRFSRLFRCGLGWGRV